MRYIVGYTDTPAGHDALALGVRLARTDGARLDVVLVLANEERPTIVPADPGYEKFLRDTADGWLEGALARVPADVRATSHLVYAESLADGLLDAIDTLGAHLVVVGAARGGLLGRFALSSAANSLLHAAPVPVALAPSGARDLGEASVTRITCAVGTRAGADALLAEGIRLARGGGVPLRLISLVALDEPTGTDRPEALARARDHAEEVLAHAASQLPADLTVTSEVATGSAIDDAVTTIEWDAAEIVLVGSSRLAQPRRLFLGSTAAKMLRELPVPLVVVPRDSATVDGDPS
ncbi:universal stress protein [Herbiconiux liukaitaii]|uniref:universal stress protein n=1 Tax=Herbiconiux liukaitaii TaxID=3342799 RepID=UPI0035BA7C5B